MVVVLTHEHEKGTVAATDEGITIQELVKPLKTCKSLAGKPKMIFIQACSLLVFWIGEGIDNTVRDVCDVNFANGRQ
jgi:hypothetical protein